MRHFDHPSFAERAFMYYKWHDISFRSTVFFSPAPSYFLPRSPNAFELLSGAHGVPLEGAQTFYYAYGSRGWLVSPGIYGSIL